MILSPEASKREPCVDHVPPGRNRKSLFAAIGGLFAHNLRKRSIWAGDLEGIIVAAFVCVALFGCVLFLIAWGLAP
jgi:hypothetical protein